MADKSYKLTLSLSDGSTINAGTITAPQGPTGANGVTFTPSVSSAGVLSWTNNGGLTNPSPINIKGPKGDDAVITESDVAGWGFTKNAGTITGIKMNGVSKGSSGVIDLGTVLTAHQDISGKANLSGGNTFSGNQIFTGYLDIRGTAAEKHLKTRGIGGSDGNGNSSDLYLQYSSDFKTYFGKTGNSSLNADGSITINGKAVLTAHQDISGKQDKLTAGANITISGKTISATDTGAVGIDVVGGGNAVTGASYSASTRLITLTKGATFLTEHQSLANYVDKSSDQTISGFKKFTSALGIASNYSQRVFSSETDIDSYVESPSNAYTYTTQTSKAFMVNTDANNRIAIVDGRIDNKKNGTVYKLTFPTKEGTLATMDDIPDVPDPVTSINGLSGGTLSSALVLNPRNTSGYNGHIEDANGNYIFGFLSAYANDIAAASNNLGVGHSSRNLLLRGKAYRPSYNGADLARYSDISVPNVPEMSIQSDLADVRYTIFDAGYYGVVECYGVVDQQSAPAFALYDMTNATAPTELVKITTGSADDTFGYHLTIVKGQDPDTGYDFVILECRWGGTSNCCAKGVLTLNGDVALKVFDSGGGSYTFSHLRTDFLFEI